MASTPRRRRKDGTYSHYVRYRDGRGKDVWERCASGKHARARKAQVELLLAQSDGAWSPPERVTIAEYTERWLAEKAATLRPQTLESYRRAFERHVLPAFGRYPLAALTRADIKQYAAQQASAGAAANTVRNALAPLRAMLATAVEDGLVRENVALRLPRVGRTAKTITPPPRADVDRVLATTELPARGPIQLAASSGLRRGEVFALRWQDIDFDRRLIHVRGSNHKTTINKPKTAAGERLVPMFGSTRLLLLEVRAASPFKNPDDLVFPSLDGTPQHPETWMSREFYPALKRARVPHFRFHDLRHFAVSQLIAQGANILQISRIAGHADPSITLRVYSHLLADGLAEAADRYDPLAALTAPATADTVATSL